MTSSPADLTRALTWRYATKAFDASRTIPDDVWNALEQSMLLAPSSFGLQPWRFIVVRDAALRTRLREAAWNQAQITDASHLVVMCHRRTVTVGDVDRLADRMAVVRDRPRSEFQPYRDRIADYVANPRSDISLGEWNARQVYIAMGFFLTAAAQLGIDACPMEGFDPVAFDRMLSLDGTEFTTTVVAAAGYRDPADKYGTAAKVRYDACDVIEHR